MKAKLFRAALGGFTIAAFAATPNDGTVLQFPPTVTLRQQGRADVAGIHSQTPR